MKKLTIRWKFIFSSFGVVLTTVLIICIVVTYTLNKNLVTEVAQFRQLEIEKAKENLKSFVDIAYSLVKETKGAADRGEIATEEIMPLASKQIEQLRYDSGTGYFWINDTGAPIPKMIMHPTVPALNGTILDNPKFNCAQGQGKNLFVAFVDESKETGEGYVDYLWPKPTKDGLTSEQPKLSYVRLFQPLNWIIGTGKYIDDIDAAVAVKKNQAEGLISKLIFSISSISLGLLFLAFFPLLIAAKRIVSPITQCIEFAGKVQDGDLSGFVDVKSRDETGLLANALNNMVETMRQILSDVYEHSALVVMVSNKLADSSDKMSNNSKQVSEQTHSVAAAAEQVASNISSVSDSANNLSQRSQNIATNTNEMSDNVNSVASAVEEMSNSFKAVAKHCSDAQIAASKNQQSSDMASTRIKDLSEAAANIGNVISLIDQITSQTKLLALNATIEAATAGDAGKGFSVVANEVKELAGQTAKATEAISARIIEMQKKTEEVVTMIQEVSVNNQELNEINTSIASAVEEQSVTTAEIARTIAGAAQGTIKVSDEVQEVTVSIQGEISSNINEASLGVIDVSSNIQQVNKGVKESASTAVGNVSFAKEMAKIASELRGSFNRFNLDNRKFDIGMIKAAHISWKLHLESMLNKGAELSLDEIPDHTQCDFGKWLATDNGKGLQSHTGYPEMIRLHGQVHSIAHQIADLHHKGEQKKASELMKKFNTTSQNLFAALDKLYVDD